MDFLKYQHIERLGTNETRGVDYGSCYIFPKIDGTNSSLWWNEGLRAGSRNRELGLGEEDNGGFYKWALGQPYICSFFVDNPHLRLFGEWLIPHSLKTYRQSAWDNFYVFDVMIGGKYLHYEEYKPILDKYGIDYITPLCKIENPSLEKLNELLEKNFYLIEDNKGSGEGIVIKNYSYKNPFDRVVWAKIVKNEFKELHSRTMGVGEVKEKALVEQEIVNKYVNSVLVEKEFAKIDSESGLVRCPVHLAGRFLLRFR